MNFNFALISQEQTHVQIKIRLKIMKYQLFVKLILIG